MKNKPKHKTASHRTSIQKGGNNAFADDKKRRLVVAALLAIAGFLLYANTFFNGYVLDDFSAIKENNIVRQGTAAIPEIFKTSYRQGYLSVKDGLYRPLSLATFAIEWGLFPDKPGVAHFTNAVLYGATGWLLFLLLCRLFSPLTSGWSKPGEVVAFIASLLFLVHPLHVEVVANIKSRDEMLCFLFVILAFFAVFKYLETNKPIYLAGGLLAYFLSLLSKETSITFLALLPLSLHFFSSANLKKIIPVTLFFVGVAGLYLLIRQSVLEGAMADNSVSAADNVIVAAKTASTRIGTAFYILGLYVGLHVFPHPLSYDYSFKHLPVVGMDHLLSILSVLFYVSIAVYAAIAAWRWLKQKEVPGQQRPETNLQVAFGVLFFLITIFLFSNLVLTIGTSMGDRLMYFPSLGFCIVVASLYVRYAKINSSPLSQWALAPRMMPLWCLVALFSYKTWTRNADWKDNYTLYSHDVQLVPNSVKAHYYLGLELIKTVAEAEQEPEKKRSFLNQGISELQKAVEIMPGFSSAFTQMGVAYYRLKEYEKAVENYEKAVALQPADAITLNNIGSVYFEWGKYSEAAEKFRSALQIDPRFVDAHMNLGSVLGTLKDYNNAIASFQNAIKFAPDNGRAHYFIGITYQNMGDKANADKYFQQAAKIDPRMAAPAQQ